MTVQDIKNRFGIIGNSKQLDRAIDIAMQVAATGLTVLISGESGTGKEVFPQIIHQLSHRKHGQYIAVNCGAIPEGTIDSELFGHERGSFTGAVGERKGYFEVADGGTIFLDEVAELPLHTQVRLLRVLESGEYIRVGSSKALKTDVRIVCATNINIPEAIRRGKFREDLFYRLNTVPIIIPPLRDRKEDIFLLFRKFASDFASAYKTSPIRLEDESRRLLENYRWPGNVRQLKNITEQVSIIEKEKNINPEVLLRYLPTDNETRFPVLHSHEQEGAAGYSDRELIYKILFDMRRDMSELRRMVFDAMQNGGSPDSPDNYRGGQPFPGDITSGKPTGIIYEASRALLAPKENPVETVHPESGEHHEPDKIPLLADQETELIKKALTVFKGNRRKAAKALGISERTLYRKIDEYKLEEGESKN